MASLTNTYGNILALYIDADLYALFTDEDQVTYEKLYLSRLPYVHVAVETVEDPDENNNCLKDVYVYRVFIYTVLIEELKHFEKMLELRSKLKIFKNTSPAIAIKDVTVEQYIYWDGLKNSLTLKSGLLVKIQEN